MKKTVAILLLLTSFLFINPQLIKAQTVMENDDNLYNFLQSNKEISAVFEYPSYIASSNIKGKTLLPAHTPIVIENTHEINSTKIHSGEIIDFMTVKDVTSQDGQILIKAGTTVSAKIDFKKKEMIGRSAELTISDFSVKAVDGSYIPLSTVITEAPDDKMVLSIVLSVLVCPLFLLMKGKDAKLPAGTVKTVYSTADTYVNCDLL